MQGAWRGANLIGSHAIECTEWTMKIWRLWTVCLSLCLSGCVIGSGPCLWLAPVKHTFTGVVHFKDFPAANGVDNVPILAVDDAAYIYTPNHRHQCQAANDLQLIGVSEFPDNVGENSRVKVKGTVSEAGSAGQYTHFSIDVTAIAPIKAAP
jgi:hypothetical protein